MMAGGGGGGKMIEKKVLQEPQQRRYREKKAEADSETDEDWEKRVVNGIDPYWGERFSFYVRVQSLVGVGHNQWASVFCGGSVVAARYVLTHEKCIKGIYQRFSFFCSALGSFSYYPQLILPSFLWCNEWFYKVDYQDQICLAQLN